MKFKLFVFLMIFILFSINASSQYSDHSENSYGTCPDFNRDNIVNYDDFFLFADNFGREVEKNYVYDLDKDLRISIEDFFIFADDFGKKVKCIRDSDTLIVCEEVPPGQYKTIRCPRGGKITRVIRSDLVNYDSDFSCDNLNAISSCRGYCGYVDTYDCIGNTECEIFANKFTCNNDPCPGINTKLITEYGCSDLEDLPAELAGGFYKFTFESWKREDASELMDYLCGFGDWVEIKGVYQCNFNNGNELDGAYELAVDIYGEPFDGNDKQIRIVRDDSQEYSGFDGFTNTLTISLLSDVYGIEPAKFTLAHELLHSFRFSFDSSSFYDLYSEGFVEGASHVIRSKLKELSSYRPEEEEYSFYSIFNDEAIITNNGAFHYEFSPISSMQYQTGAYVWLELYAQDKDFFKKFNSRLDEELVKDPNFKNDLINLNRLVKEIIPSIDGISISEWMDRNHIFSSSGNKGIFGFLFGVGNEFMLLDRKSALTQPSDPDEFNVNLEIYNYNNELVFESEMKNRYSFYLASPEYYWRAGSSIGSSFGRYKKAVTAENVDGDTYTDFYLISLPLGGIISGVVAPYNEGTLRIIPESRNEITLEVNNGAFKTNSAELNDFEGIIKFEFESPLGDRIVKTVYKLNGNLFVLLNDEPFISHNPVLEIKPSSNFETVTTAYNSDVVEVYYKYEEQTDYENIIMNNIGADRYSASIPLNQGSNSIKYYIIASKSNGASFVYPKSGFIKTVVSSIPTIQWRPTRILEHTITNPNYIISIEECRIDGLGCGGNIVLNNENLRVLDFNSESVPVIKMGAYPNLIQETEATFKFTEGAITKELTVYLPSIDFRDSDITLELFVANEGSTYWKKNTKLGIENPTFEDAVKNRHLARSTP